MLLFLFFCQSYKMFNRNIIWIYDSYEMINIFMVDKGVHYLIVDSISMMVYGCCRLYIFIGYAGFEAMYGKS